MHALIYISSAVSLFTRDDLLALLAQSREANARRGITGLLLYKDGSIMQLIEGEAEAVRDLYARVARDPRHRGLQVLVDGPAPGRQFPEWTMGFRDLASDEARAVPGFSEFLNTPLTGEEFSAEPTRCQRLLLTFKRHM